MVSPHTHGSKVLRQRYRGGGIAPPGLAEGEHRWAGLPAEVAHPARCPRYSVHFTSASARSAAYAALCWSRLSAQKLTDTDT